MTNTAIRRATGALVPGLFIAVGCAVSNRTQIVRAAKQVCLDMGRQGGPTWKAGYHLMKDPVPTYRPNAWG
jgi:hypothetical protein